MTDYNFHLDLNTENSNSLIIRRIVPNSEVLEFGPAYGRMTKYLKEQLHCQVDIVEYNESAGREAAKYARSSCLGAVEGNIENDKWLDRFQGRQYDAIIFADVLEHLRQPKLILAQCRQYLKGTGSIFCSIPNIAHSSVILSLLQDDFSYKTHGLLDSTHLKFFTKTSFEHLIKELNYQVIYECAVESKVGTNEIPYGYDSGSAELVNILKARENGEAYQYIFEFRPKTALIANDPVIIDTLPPVGWQSKCYFRMQSDMDFSESRKILQKIFPDKMHQVLNYSLSNYNFIEGIRIDPIDCICLLRIHSIDIVSIDGKHFQPEFTSNGEKLSSCLWLFYKEPPQLYFLSPFCQIEDVSLDFEILAYNMPALQHFHSLKSISEDFNNLYIKYTEMEDKLLQQQLQEKRQKIILEKYQQEITYWQQTYEKAQNNANVIEQQRDELHQRLTEALVQRDAYYATAISMQNSILWKITAPIRSLLDLIRKPFHLVRNAFIYYKNYGLKKTWDLAIHYGQIQRRLTEQSQEVAREAAKDEIWEKLLQWIDSTPHDFIDIFGVPMGWNTPLFQRFQHISLQTGKAGGISFYGAHPSVDSDVLTYQFFSPTLCLVNLQDPEVFRKFFQVLDTRKELKILRLQSIDLATTTDQLRDYSARGYQIVYEYIDEITPQITGDVPDFVMKRHEYILHNEDIVVIATSDKLFSQVSPYRTRHMAMINNGVDYSHWHLSKAEVSCPDDLSPILKKAACENKLIVGYHGALAQWIDYDLLKKISQDGRYLLLLIGFEHDNNLKKSKLLDEENVFFLGSKNYQELNQYTVFYDIGILPFVINNTTLSVSPVKIFEYMAAGKPIVSYALPECKKYVSCLCAEDQTEFMEKLEKAVYLRDDKAYLLQLEQDALANTWEEITRRTVQLAKECDEDRRQDSARKNLVNPKLASFQKDAYINMVAALPKDKDENLYCSFTEEPYQRQSNDCKIIAYYLTQFHPDAHNEQWWGRGVTEWNNVVRAVPQFEGHYQPRLPGELGFYDLRLIENMQRQVELAQTYGIYGFSFYYYWFNGERLLERPLEMFLEHPQELDFPFSLCWANENWTRRYDGTNMDILMEQSPTLESYKRVIEDMIRFFKDARYITINGKKLVTVYRPSMMPNPRVVLDFWRNYCRTEGIGELYIIAVKENMVETDWLKEGFDALSEFHPGTLYYTCQNLAPSMQFIRKDFGGEVFSYSDIVIHQKYFRYNYPKLYRAAMPMWDNTARRDHKGMIFDGSTPGLYKTWLKDIIKESYTRTDLDDHLIFINAWNEWGEGAYLEPDKRYGYAYLEATKEAIEESRNFSKS